MGFERFSKIWMVDFEFISEPGELPKVVCMVAREYRTGEVMRVWENEFCLGPPIFLLDQECLVVAYFASAEVGCFLELGWPLPNNLIDLRRIPRSHKWGANSLRQWTFGCSRLFRFVLNRRG